MDPQLVQNLRYKLQKRVRRLNSVGVDIFAPTLRQFWTFFDERPMYSGVARSLMFRFPNASKTMERILAGEALVGASEEESAAIGHEILRSVAREDRNVDIFQLAYPYGQPSQLGDALELVREIFLEPFYEYVDESLDDQRAMLALLLRYKHRSEWFHRSYLWNLVQTESQKAEKSLALDLYSFFYDQGIDFTIEPSSLTGEIDLIAAQGSSDPLLADAKVFDADGRGKAYIRKAFRQIYSYTQQYNEAFGYLMIFKTGEKDLRFSLKATNTDIPVVCYNHKTIFLITVDIYQYPKPVSQRSPLSTIEVTEEELITTVQEPGETS